MKPQAKFSITGLRGVWGNTLNEDNARSHIEAYAIYLQKRNAKRILLARDSRHSGPIIQAIATDILTKAGFEVTYAGIIPTPTVIYLTRTTPFNGAIMITASHNPPEYNGIKFLTSSAFYINETELEEIRGYVGSTPTQKEGGGITEDNTLAIQHVEQVLKNINVENIRSRKFKVVLDTINGTGYFVGPTLLEKLGCEVTVINGIPDGNFAHMPEPLAENLTGLSEKVREVGADIGFAQDPDADRLVFCDEHGVMVLEEYMLSLAIKSVLDVTPGDIVTNLSTSNTNEDLVKAVGHNIYRTKVGEGHVVQGIIDHHAVIGGEGSGGCIYPKINLCRDSLAGMGLILELLARESRPVSEIVASLPQYVSIKTKMDFAGDAHAVIQKMIEEFKDGIANTEDGVRIDFSDSSWVQLRTSNTEPLIRIWSEARTKERAEALIERAQKQARP